MTRAVFLCAALIGLVLLAACRSATSAPSEPSPTPTTVATGSPVADADVEYVRAVEDAVGTWTFHVTVRHPDTGWEDTVLKPDPDSPFTRLLLHPHETEQPFTRSQSGIAIPPAVDEVRVRAHDLVDGWGGREVQVDLTADSGKEFEIVRSAQ